METKLLFYSKEHGSTLSITINAIFDWLWKEKSDFRKRNLQEHIVVSVYT